MDQIRKIAVVGAGLMGHGIAQEFALAGYSVWMQDLTDDILGNALRGIRGNLRMLETEKLVDASLGEAALGRLRASTNLEEAVADADLVIEAMAEELEQKRKLFRQLDALCPRHAILATNSSSFMPGSLAVATERPDKVVGTHYFNPPYLIPLVEIIRGKETSDETVDAIQALLVKVGKSPVLVRKEVPGFIANRMQAALLREALALVEDGVATAQEIDRVITTSIGRRWAVAGVFEVTEIAGWDLKRAILTELLPSIASSPEVPSIVGEKVDRGELGIKTGRGFYDWTPESAAALRRRITQALIAIERWP